MNKAKRLIGVGYLPKELPIEFTSTPLSRSYAPISALIQQQPPNRTGLAEKFNLARTGHAVRVLRVPNPIFFTAVATLIDANWDRLKTVTSSSSLSISKPLFRALGKDRRTRATNLSPSQDLPERRLLSVAGQRYVLQTDFARFFPSIYTHSIPWAIYGKSAAKRNRSPALFGNALDKAVRDGQGGQTVGLPVGPDSSHILSELIAARVDRAAFSRRTPSGFRYIDDYFLGFATEGAAMGALDRLAEAAREYELELNYSKTSIRSVQDMREGMGVDELRDFEFADPTNLTRSECHRIFAIAERLRETEEYALKFAIQMLAPRLVSAADWAILESYLLRSGTLAPNCLDLVAFMLYRHSLLGAPLNQERIIEYLTFIVSDGITYNRDSCVTWALWAFKSLGYQLPRKLTQRLSKTSNSIVALLALDLRDRGQLSGNLDVRPWTNLLQPDELYGEHWLLVYESVRSGWLNPVTPILQNDVIFNGLLHNNVQFYDNQRLARVTALLRHLPRAEGRNHSYGPIQSFLLAIDPQEAAAEPVQAVQPGPEPAVVNIDQIAGGDIFEYEDELTDEEIDEDADEEEQEEEQEDPGWYY